MLEDNTASTSGISQILEENGNGHTVDQPWIVIVIFIKILSESRIDEIDRVIKRLINSKAQIYSALRDTRR